MTKPTHSDVVRKALETAAARELAVQAAWEERSRAADLFEGGRLPRADVDGAIDPANVSR